MALKPIEIQVLTDSTQAVRGFNDVEKAAEGASSRFDNAAERTDNLDSKAAAATGSLGALSSGFELVGLDKYAAGLQGAALATDFFSGVGQGLTLILESQTVRKIKDTAATVGNTVATVANTVASKAAAAASKAWAIAQRALNLALAANPIGLIIAAIALLVAGIVLAYQKSDTFRRIVDAAGRAGKEAIGWIVDRISDVIDIAGKVIGWFRDKIPAAISTLWDKVGPILDAIIAPFQTLLDLIKDVVDWIKKIDFPDVPDLTFWNRAVTLGGTIVSASDLGRPPEPTTVKLLITSEMIDAVQRGRQVEADLKAYVDAGGAVRVLA